MRTNRSTCSSLAAATILVALLGPGRALGHRIDVSAHVAEGKIIVEAYYNDHAPVPQAAVTVSDSAGKVLVQGTTDTDGRFLFTLAAIPARISVAVETGDGHRGTATVSRAELSGSSGHVEEHDHAEAHSATSAPPVDDDSSADHHDLHEIEATLTRIESELHEIAHEMEHLSERGAGTTFEMVLAGVGFILGLTGVATYCLARQPRNN